ncbi:MAG TPA: DUF1572 family protein [Pyrinomonadaceae bacterium]|nr:DUF1572 family protein [Pyrinomonadaceae bacterium]
MSELGKAFIAQSRYHLAEDYLPKIERCLALLDDKQIWWRANPESNSIGNLLLHLGGNVRQWIVCGLGDATDGRDRDSEFAQRDMIPRAELLRRLKQTLREADATLAKFDPEKLLEQKRIQGFDGSALDAILHVVEHFSMHTGQIILLAKMFAEVDIEFYDFSGANPVLAWKREL